MTQSMRAGGFQRGPREMQRAVDQLRERVTRMESAASSFAQSGAVATLRNEISSIRGQLGSVMATVNAPEIEEEITVVIEFGGF